MRTVGKHGEKATNPGVTYEASSRRASADIAFRVVPVVALLVAMVFTWPSGSGDQVTSISADTTLAPNETATAPRRTTTSLDLAGEQPALDAFAVTSSTESPTTTTTAGTTTSTSRPALQVPNAEEQVATTQPGEATTTTAQVTATTKPAPTVPKALLASEPTIRETTTTTSVQRAVTPTTGSRTTTTRATSTQPRATSAPTTSRTPTTGSATTTTTRATSTRPTVATTNAPPTTAATTTTTARRATTTQAPTTLATTTTIRPTTTTARATTTTLATTTTTEATTTTLPTTTTTAATTTTTQATTTTTVASGNCNSSGEFERVFRDDFNGSSLSGSWTQFGGTGYRNNGIRSSSALSVEGGRLVITADMVNGGLVSGGISHRYYQQYGKYVFRIRTDDDPSSAMSGVALTWPLSDDNRADGENNIYETLANAVDRNPFYSFIHEPNGGAGDQKRFVHNADGSQFQTMTMEWTPDKISITRSGPGGSVTTETQTLNETGANLIPDNQHRLSFQLDPYKNSISQAVKMEVDWVEVHKYCG